jgi:predicted AAA+ superfamily ATPase
MTWLCINTAGKTKGSRLHSSLRVKNEDATPSFFVIGQLTAFIHYRRLDLQLYYWRTHHGAEVDVLLCKGNRIICAVEIKSSQNIARENLAGLMSFTADNARVPAYVLGRGQNVRQLKNNITVMNWDNFIIERLEKLV